MEVTYLQERCIINSDWNKHTGDFKHAFCQQANRIFYRHSLDLSERGGNTARSHGFNYDYEPLLSVNLEPVQFSLKII